jgi:signal transduction histidine kinase
MYWPDAVRYGIDVSAIVGQVFDERFAPVASETYCYQIQRTLQQVVSQQFHYPFRCGSHYLVFDVVMSPVLLPGRSPSTVVVVGTLHQVVSDISEAQPYLDAIAQGIPIQRYQHNLSQVAWNIRRTLNLDAIWQKTVNGLGETLGVARCLICPYEPDYNAITVTAEYSQSGAAPAIGTQLSVHSDTPIGTVLSTRQPAVMHAHVLGLNEQEPPVLAVATCHKDEPNGLIFLQYGRAERQWLPYEISLIQELANQIGTDISHAKLYTESQNLATKLRAANDRLRQKHQELEEAREQAEEASRLKSDFLANTSHELRTPLNGMIGFLKLVIDGMADDPEEQAEFIEEAHRSAVHLLNIINDILDIAKIEAGKMQLDLDPVNLDDLMNDVANFTRSQVQQKNLSFEIRTPAIRDPVILYGNYQRLLQVMLNLVGNAIKFTHDGGITITAEVIEKTIVQGQENPGIVKIGVADTGIGVSLEKQDKLFQNFSQIDGSRTRQYGGTGLGLVISQKLIEAMGGVVSFFSMGEGLGSTVTFTVPLFQDPIMVPSSQSAEDLLNP